MNQRGKDEEEEEEKEERGDRANAAIAILWMPELHVCRREREGERARAAVVCMASRHLESHIPTAESRRRGGAGADRAPRRCYRSMSLSASLLLCGVCSLLCPGAIER